MAAASAFPPTRAVNILWRPYSRPLEGLILVEARTQEGLILLEARAQEGLIPTEGAHLPV
jgi:hypothetical protein